MQGIKKIVLITSVGVEESFFPLNLFWGVSTASDCLESVRFPIPKCSMLTFLGPLHFRSDETLVYGGVKNACEFFKVQCLLKLCHFIQILFWKKRAEEAVQRSGIDYTIIRPGMDHLPSADCCCCQWILNGCTSSSPQVIWLS